MTQETEMRQYSSCSKPRSGITFLIFSHKIFDFQKKYGTLSASTVYPRKIFSNKTAINRSIKTAVLAGLTELQESDRLLGFFTPSKTAVFYSAVSGGLKKPNKRSDSWRSFIPAETAVHLYQLKPRFIYTSWNPGSFIPAETAVHSDRGKQRFSVSQPALPTQET